MKTIKQVEIKPKFVVFVPEELEEKEIYISKEYETAVHLCLCGCKQLSVTPLNKNGWALIENGDKISLSPSILNKTCPNKSHYIITNNKANFV